MTYATLPETVNPNPVLPEVTGAAYGFVDETFQTEDYSLAQREFELGGDYGSDTSGAEYVGPIGMLAFVIGAPGEPVQYKRWYEERDEDYSTQEFVKDMFVDTFEARVEEVKTVGAKISSFFGRVRQAVTFELPRTRRVSEGVVALAAGSVATRRALML